MSDLDETHDPKRRSWVSGAGEHADFPIQNLPLGIFAPQNNSPRGGVAIGDFIADLPALHATGLLVDEAGEAAAAAGGPALNDLLALGDGPRRALRRRLSQLLSDESFRGRVELTLHPQSRCRLELPCAIGDYTDFYVGIHHAMNIGRQFRPNNPLLPNYKHIPIGYHGRASSVRPSGAPVIRPNGQTKAPEADAPSFGPSLRLDYELELGIWIGPGSTLGEPVPISQAAKHIAGYTLFNDWSARDIQAWEYQPLGPFLSKNFVSTTSCWIVTPEALAPFRIPQPPRPDGDPAPLPYLVDPDDQRSGAIELELTVSLSTAAMRMQGLAPQRLALSDARYMYWTPAQLVAHHTCGGCNLRAGDLFGTGTISGPDQKSCGSLLETTLGGREPVILQTGEERRFLEDGDEVFLSARAQREGFASIGFGECRGMVRAGLSPPS
jgi:fumarylacetoacetase